MAYEMVMPYHLHMLSYFLETFTEYPYKAESLACDKSEISLCMQRKPSHSETAFR